MRWERQAACMGGIKINVTRRPLEGSIYNEMIIKLILDK
jgi:hypothetical protein